MQISIPKSSQGFVGEHEVIHRENKLRQEPEACYTDQWQASRGKALVFPPPTLPFPLAWGKGRKAGRTQARWSKPGCLVCAGGEVKRYIRKVLKGKRWANLMPLCCCLVTYFQKGVSGYNCEENLSCSTQMLKEKGNVLYFLRKRFCLF